MKELKEQIQAALGGFSSVSLADNAKNLLNILGYESDRTIKLSPNNYKGFSELFQVESSNFNPDKAKVNDWQSIDIIFQLTEGDIKKSLSLFETKQVDNNIIESYLFFAISLTGEKYTRGDLVKITREINKLTPMPAMILFRHGNYLTVAVIDRRLDQKEPSKDVLQKVTLIKDIQIAKPHRAHIEILFDLSLEALQQKTGFSNFVELHNAWRKALDTSELNKKFFRELANWYFWALKNVEFPEDAEKNKDVRNAISVIRMITRLIFIWFVKEKGLIPDELFDEVKVRKILIGAGVNHSAYYKAILQNLFFATLNTEMNKDKPGSRKFRGKRQEGRGQHYMIHNVFRYEDYFTSPQDTLGKYFENIPFLNGGLFECLDKEISPTLAKGGEGGFSDKKIVRIDGFSDHPKNVLKVPDYLFFSSEQPVDLNEIYGTKNKAYKVRGLIDILDSYKFTVDENTPIEEEIALDPELLGKVFENLLASYNPETQTTARKQTGSFYTPREIVNYMVDESIIAYLGTALDNAPSAPPLKIRGGRGSYDSRLRHLVAYNDLPHEFTPAEVDVLIAAINVLKALDPACGSGAFPMGMLHKLVYILRKLDPDNSKWRELQRQKAIKETEEAYQIGDKEEREKRLLDISEVFDNNASDYGRKLYLIENCIFGVDIQPIAVQIAKLRFFVSLIVDQRIDPKKENLGVRPLPNLETKFVAANTLIGIEKPKQMLLRNPEIDRKEKELKEIRERHFTARTPQTKEKYRKADERLRAEISELLKQDGFPRETTEKLARWNPYDQNASADFFDPEWMFGVTDGFDVTIGNPPYFNISTVSKDFYRYLAEHYKSIHTGYNDMVYYFIYLGIEFLNKNGCCAFITSNYYLGNEYAKKLRAYMKAHTSKIVNFKDHMVFDGASIHTCISISQKKVTSAEIAFFETTADKQITSSDIESELRPFAIKRVDLTDNWIIANQSNTSIFEKLKQGSILLGDIAMIAKGPETGRNNIFAITAETAIKFKIEKSILRKCIKNSNINKYSVDYKGLHLLYVDNFFDPSVCKCTFEYLNNFKSQLLNRRGPLHQEYEWYRLHRPSIKEVFDSSEKLVVPYRAEKNCFAYDDAQYFNDGGDIRAIVINDDKVNIKYVLALLNSKLIDWFYGFIGKPKGKVREYFNKPLSLIPIKKISSDDQHSFITLVDQILAAKKQPPSSPFSKGELPVVDTSALEKQIDEMVYALYGLTPEEIAIVEGKE
jgi:hypothetical protein